MERPCPTAPAPMHQHRQSNNTRTKNNRKLRGSPTHNLQHRSIIASYRTQPPTLLSFLSPNPFSPRTDPHLPIVGWFGRAMPPTKRGINRQTGKTLSSASKLCFAAEELPESTRNRRQPMEPVTPLRVLQPPSFPKKGGGSTQGKGPVRGVEMDREEEERRGRAPGHYFLDFGLAPVVVAAGRAYL